MSRKNKGVIKLASKLLVAPSPHVKSAISTSSIMMTVVVALMPAAIVSVIVFGINALLVMLVSVASAVGFEYLYRRITKQTQTVGDWSAVVTGLLLAFNLPASIPLWMVVIGNFVAIIIVKQWFGGIGDNFANPAIAARIFMFLSFASAMSTWPVANGYLGVDMVSGATPLAILTTGGTVTHAPDMINMLFGVRGGCLGETGIIALIIGGVYLIYKKVITATIPLSIFATVIVMSLIVGADPAYMLFSGGLVLGAFFMATDYSTSPVRESGKLIFGIAIGVITVVIRVYGNYPEGLSFAILLMNILTPHINNLVMKLPFGGIKK